MSNNAKGQGISQGFDTSWIPVLIMLYIFWPVGLWMLYNKIKKSSGPKQRKSVSWMSVGMFVAGAAMFAGRGGHLLGMFALLGGAAVFAYSRKMKFDERKYRKYTNVIGDRTVVPLSAIAAAMPASFEDAKRDLQAMIDEGYFGERSYIDNGRGLFVMDSRIAQSHIDELQEKFEKMRGAATEPAAPAPKKTGAAEDEYQSKLRQIRALNEAIQDEDISAKIHKIEQVTANIFELVKQKPEKRTEINTFMNYYLPTTLKLLDSYSVLEKQNVLGDNIVSTKSSIEKMVDQLVWAFERQLDQMFEAEARDIGTDITVLERMMARDGLSENPYTLPKQQQQRN